MTTSTNQTGTALIFGEVLFDCFPDGSRVLGGAPFNVAWNLCALGEEPTLISRVGNDALGDMILEHMRQWRMQTRGIQRDERHATGTVTIEFTQGTHRFSINSNQAYDHISISQLPEAASMAPASMLYCGTLAIRDQTSRKTLAHLFAHNFPRFVDINLRAPWWSLETIEFSLTGARWAKLNDDELATLNGKLIEKHESLDDAARALREHFSLDMLIITCGSKGATIYTENGAISQTPPATRIADTVGAGDAFSSVVILGLLKNWQREVILERALEFASAVCTQQGATTHDRAFYETFRRNWNPQNA